MANFSMRRSLDDFLIKPTALTMDDHALATMPSDDNITIMPPHEMFSFKPGKKTPEPSATITNFTDEPMFWRGYTSEEEVASPIDDGDDMSFHSDSSDSEPASRASQASFPEQLAQSCNRVEQQCNRAQAVTLVPAGKAKVISMPRLVDVPATPRMRRPATATPLRPPVSRLNRMEIGSQTSSQNSRTNSPRTSGERSPVSTAPSSIAEPPKRVKTVRRRPSLPALSIAARSFGTPDSSPDLARNTRRVDFLDHDPFPSSSAERPTTPMSPSKRRLHKFSSSLSLNVFGRGIRRNNSSDSNVGADLNVVKEPEPILISGAYQAVRSPIRKASVKPKMVARGANEREPPLILPPCPEDYDDDDGDDKENAGSAPWSSRKESAVHGVMMDQSHKVAKLHKRQRSSSAAAMMPEHV
ncbi:hypothetical protein LTR36_008292 [Oleoguttula mirabilis]|uniref:Uncharacterized protein n=1 Tax=Oleoguttula mirabilis TaxID=1507867 RepID=A0AAV9J807_9PEZI|nr:hypothetical protein LTR36_008292 [Oleoguttula mirabilis]